MSRDSSSTQPIQQNENEFGSLWNQLPLVPPRAPLNSIPDPSQYQSETPKKQSHDDLDDFRRKKPEGIAETQLVSAVLKTPKVHGRGKSTSSEPNSAQSTPNRSGHRLSIGGSGLMRLPAQLGNGGGRGCGLPKASRRFSIATPQQLLTDVPHFELQDDPSFWNDHNVQVLIRIRPLNSTEMISQGYGRCLRQESAQTVVWLGHPETRFTFDHTAGESISQEKLFRAAGLPMVDNCMSGYNSCMFAYGQTGSGKTYTMMGEIDKMDGKLNEDCGITPRIFEYLFSRITKEEESRAQERLTYSCKCSFLEIYNEQITDLLEPSSTNLQLREDSKKGVYVENLTEHSVRTVNDVLQLLQQGAANRRIAATHMNCESSRSHSVFTCIIESRWEKDSMAHLRFGRLNLVDLAGSERQKSSGAEGDRLKEAANINKSLSTLGLVIMSLVDLAQGKHRHVPYRDSRLTFLLQDSLGGNSKTTIIANVSPSICAANETLSTLKFAQRAKLIQNNAKINEDASAGVIALQQQILHLKDQLSFLMKHQHDSVKLIPGEEHSSLGFFSEGYDPTNETSMHDEDETRKGGLVKKKYFKATLLDASRREKLAETEIKSLKAEIESLNRLAHQHEEEAQRARMMLKFQEEKIKRLELLLNGLVSVDKLSLDENTALRDENLSLQAKIERKPEVIKFATEKNRFQDFHEQGERKTLLAEISESHNQLLESLEVQKSQAHHQLSAMEKYQEPEVSKELEQCREMNAKLLREVDELPRQLSNRRESSEDTFNSIYNVPRGSDMADGATSNNFPGDEVTDVSNEEKSYLQIMQCDNIDKQLMDAQSLIETLKLEQLKLITELESVKTENQLLVKMLESNQYSTVSIEGNEGTSILALQDKLEKLSKDLKEAHILNKAHIEDRAARISQDHQAEVVLSEVEMETTRTIIHLQEEIDRLQSEFHCCLCSVAEENLSLRKSVAAKEDELRVLCKEWERATLELTTFLIDSSRSMGNASREIKSISSSFPNVNGWINEHVEMAAKMCVEKEETILLLQNSLEDAQNTVIQMEEKLHSLRGATIALTKVQQSERFSSREEIQLSRMPHDMTEVKDFPVHKFMSKKGDVTGSQAHTSIPVETRISNHSTSTPGGIFDENQPLVCASTLATRDVDIQVELTTLIAETKNAVNGSCADAEAYISAMNSEIHDTISLAKGLIQDVIKDVNDFRNDIDGLKRNRGSLHFLSNTFPSHVPFRHGNQLLMLQQVRNELVEINDRLNSMSACFYKVVNMHCNLDSTDVHTEIDGCTSGCFSSCSSASVESFDNDDKPSSSERYRCMDKITDQPLDLNSDEQSNLTCKRAILLLRKEFRKTYEAFIKIKNHLMVFSTGEENQNCSAGLLSISDLHAEEKLNKHGNGVDQPTSKRTETYTNLFGELAVEEKHNPPSSFFTKCEEAYAAMKEADYMLKAMLKANEHANTLTTMWKQAGEELMSDNASLSEEVKQLKSCVHLKNGEKEVLLNAIQSTLSEKADILSSLEECLCAMQTGAEELFKTASSDATNVVEEMKTCFDSFRSSLEDLMCKAIQNDISIFVLQFQIGEYSHKFQRLNTISNSDRPILQEHPLVADNIEPSQDHNSVLETAKCGSKGCQVACVSRMETTESEMVDGDDVDKSSKLQRELERKDILLKGLLFDFSLLQEFASHRKDIKDELEKLIVAMSKVQKELHTKSVQLDDILVEKTKLEGCLSEAEQALFSSKSELNQAKEALNIFSEQNVALKDILRDLYLKNSEAEELLEDRKEAIKSLEGEIIRLSSQEKHSVSSVKDYEDALMNVTAERDQLLEKLTSLQDKLDMVYSVADENQAIAAEARQESETSKMYAEQKEEEVKILERSVEELESTINVLEKKVLEMEGDVERQRLIRDSLEVELQALRERLLTVEDLTESMTSENSSAGVLEDQLSRKLHSRTKKINEAHSHIRFLEEENAKQAEEIRQFRDYISELVLHAEAQASQYQQKYKTLEAMLKEVRTDVTNVSAAPTSERADKLSARTRGSSSPFRCIAGLVQQMNQEKDQELSSARLRIEELEALAACRYKEVCVLNTRLATAESMTHDVIRDLLSVKLDISNYANIIEQHQLQDLIEEAQHRRQDFVAMEHEVANLRSQIDDLLEERERCYAEINRNKADQLALQIALEQLQEQDQFLIAQNDMLKMDKCNLQKRVAELDDMVKKLFSMQDSQPQRTRRPFEFELGERLARSQKMLSIVNGQLAQYRRPEGTCSDSKMVGDVNENMSRGRRSRNQNHSSE